MTMEIDIKIAGTHCGPDDVIEVGDIHVDEYTNRPTLDVFVPESVGDKVDFNFDVGKWVLVDRRTKETISRSQ